MSTLPDRCAYAHSKVSVPGIGSVPADALLGPFGETEGNWTPKPRARVGTGELRIFDGTPGAASGGLPLQAAESVAGVIEGRLAKGPGDTASLMGSSGTGYGDGDGEGDGDELAVDGPLSNEEVAVAHWIDCLRACG